MLRSFFSSTGSLFRRMPALFTIGIILLLAAVVGAVVIYSKHNQPDIFATGAITDEASPDATQTLLPGISSSTGKALPSKTPKSTPSSSPSPSMTTNAGGTQTSSFTTTAVSPTPVVTSNQEVTVSTNSVTLTISRGETKQNVFSFTSYTITQFELITSPTANGSAFSWNPASGGINLGETKNVSVSASPNTQPSSYTGTIQLIFQPGNITKTISYNVTVVEPPASSMGFTFSADSINITAKNDGSEQNVFTFTSTGSTSYTFSINFNNPKPAGGGINYLASGGSVNGITHQQYIQIYQNVILGTYTGYGLFRDGTTGAEKTFPVTIIVSN